VWTLQASSRNVIGVTVRDYPYEPADRNEPLALKDEDGCVVANQRSHSLIQVPGDRERGMETTARTRSRLISPA
jgi:hypothetical protein